MEWCYGVVVVGPLLDVVQVPNLPITLGGDCPLCRWVFVEFSMERWILRRYPIVVDWVVLLGDAV